MLKMIFKVNDTNHLKAKTSPVTFPIGMILNNIEKENENVNCSIVSMTDANVESVEYTIKIWRNKSSYKYELNKLIEYVNSIDKAISDISRTRKLGITDLYTNISDFLYNDKNINEVENIDIVHTTISVTLEDYRVNNIIEQAVASIADSFNIEYRMSSCYKTDTVFLYIDGLEKDAHFIYDNICELLDQMVIAYTIHLFDNKEYKLEE